jgi:serine/threonine protein kinase
MSSGTLPLAKYHRASRVGEGSFGSVLTVYDDNGSEYAIKLFAKEDENDPIDIGALREISCLRLLRQQNAHPNVIALVDVQSSILDEEEEGGAGTEGLGMVLPLFPDGSVAAAIHDKRLHGLPRRDKVRLAHGLLSAVAYLHDNGIIHRDIKSDNVLLKLDENGMYHPVLIDFSLAKPINATMWELSQKDQSTNKMKKNSAGSSSLDFSTWKTDLEAFRHTGEVGTVTYTAPEVFQEEESQYGLLMDLWSVGIVLLEVWMDKLLEAQKNSHALKLVESLLASLPDDKPFPNLLRKLLQVDPSCRCSARDALQHDVFAKLNLPQPSVQRLDIATSLPYETDDDDNDEDGGKTSSSCQKALQRKAIQRRKLVEKLCNELGGAENPMTIPAALDYAKQMEQLDDEVDDLSQSTTLLDCVVLAFRFWERDVLDLEVLEECDKGSFANWSMEDYLDNETTLFVLLDYCLYPRTIR